MSTLRLNIDPNKKNDYSHIEIMISATEMLGGSGACSPR